MSTEIFARLGEQLRGQRQKRGLNQPDLARRLGRNPSRISELERDLLGGRLGRDRLTLFAEICDALDLVPVLVPRSRAGEIRRMLEGEGRSARPARTVPSAFDDLFVDLGDEDEDN